VVGVLKARRTLTKSLGAYRAEYSGIARFRGNFHSLGEFPFLDGEREGERRGGKFPCRKMSGIHYSALSLVLKLDSGPFNFTLPSFGLKLIAVSFSHSVAACNCVQTSRRGDISNERKKEAGLRFGPVHASFHGTLQKMDSRWITRIASVLLLLKYSIEISKKHVPLIASWYVRRHKCVMIRMCKLVYPSCICWLNALMETR